MYFTFFNDFIFDDKDYLYFVQDKDNYYLALNVPGFSDKDIKVEIDKRNLSVSAKKEVDKLFHSKNSFSYKYNLPKDVDLEGNIIAECRDGVLSLTFPKKQLIESHPKLIPVTSK